MEFGNEGTKGRVHEDFDPRCGFWVVMNKLRWPGQLVVRVRFCAQEAIITVCGLWIRRASCGLRPPGQRVVRAIELSVSWSLLKIRSADPSLRMPDCYPSPFVFRGSKMI